MLWYCLQARVELCAQGQAELFGWSTDLVKAFNNLPRLPLFHVASQLGIPQQVLVPWQNFLAGARKRFLIRDSLSHEVLSSSGFPEGDPLSTVAMAVAGWIYHAYLQEFAPAIRPMRFVDNV